MTDKPFTFLSAEDLEADMKSGGAKVYKNVTVDLTWFDNPKRVHYIGMMKPRMPGALLFFTMLEYIYFPPATPKNSQFTLVGLEWIDALWTVVSIPKDYKPHARAIAKKCGVKIEDGVPTELVKDPITKQLALNYFPIHNKNAFNLSIKKEHPMYKQFGIDKKWFRIEDDLIRVVKGKDVEKANDFLKDWSF